MRSAVTEVTVEPLFPASAGGRGNSVLAVREENRQHAGFGGA